MFFGGHKLRVVRLVSVCVRVSSMGYDPSQTLAIHQDNDLVFRVSVDDDKKDIAFFAAGKGPIAGLPEHN